MEIDRIINYAKVASKRSKRVCTRQRAGRVRMTYSPRCSVGGIVRPQFNAEACITRISRKVNRITHQGRKVFTGIGIEILIGVVGIDFFYQPTGVIGGVVCPQFHTRLITMVLTIGVKVDDIANQVGHVLSVIIGIGDRSVVSGPYRIEKPCCTV